MIEAAQMGAAETAGLRAALKLHHTKKLRDAIGVVYLVGQPGTTFVKIGIALDAQSRLDSLQIGNPFRLVLLHTVPGSRREESKLHSRYRHRRVRGEWFDDHDGKITAWFAANEPKPPRKSRKGPHKCTKILMNFRKPVNTGVPTS